MMTAVALLTTVSSTVVSTTYFCQVDDSQRSRIEIRINDDKATLASRRQTRTCVATRDADTLKAAQKNLRDNYRLELDIENIVACEDANTARNLVYLISRNTFLGSRYNTLIMNPAVGPHGRAACRRQL
jgi:hypothetical protein